MLTWTEFKNTSWQIHNTHGWYISEKLKDYKTMLGGVAGICIHKKTQPTSMAASWEWERQGWPGGIWELARRLSFLNKKKKKGRKIKSKYDRRLNCYLLGMTKKVSALPCVVFHFFNFSKWKFSRLPGHLGEEAALTQLSRCLLSPESCAKRRKSRKGRVKGSSSTCPYVLLHLQEDFSHFH